MINFQIALENYAVYRFPKKPCKRLRTAQLNFRDHYASVTSTAKLVKLYTFINGTLLEKTCLHCTPNF